MKRENLERANEINLALHAIEIRIETARKLQESSYDKDVVIRSDTTPFSYYTIPFLAQSVSDIIRQQIQDYEFKKAELLQEMKEL